MSNLSSPLNLLFIQHHDVSHLNKEVESCGCGSIFPPRLSRCLIVAPLLNVRSTEDHLPRLLKETTKVGYEHYYVTAHKLFAGDGRTFDSARRVRTFLYHRLKLESRLEPSFETLHGDTSRPLQSHRCYFYLRGKEEHVVSYS